jgi:hypothetical protein
MNTAREKKERAGDNSLLWQQKAAPPLPPFLASPPPTHTLPQAQVHISFVFISPILSPLVLRLREEVHDGSITLRFPASLKDGKWRGRGIQKR